MTLAHGFGGFHPRLLDPLCSNGCIQWGRPTHFMAREQGERQKGLRSQCDLQKSASDSQIHQPIFTHLMPYHPQTALQAEGPYLQYMSLWETGIQDLNPDTPWEHCPSKCQLLLVLSLIDINSNRIFWKMRHPKELIEYQNNIHLEKVQHTWILLSRFRVTSELSLSTHARLYVVPFFCTQHSAKPGQKGCGHRQVSSLIQYAYLTLTN